MSDNDTQPGPSGIQDKRVKKKKEEAKISFRVDGTSKKSTRSKQLRSQLSSSDVSLRYKLRPRNEGTQQSHFVRNLVAAPERITNKERQTKIIVHTPDPIRRGSDHHLNAVDFYYRSTLYGPRHNDEMQQFKRLSYERKLDLEERWRKAKETAKAPKRYCRNCLEPISKCICILGLERQATSDWTKLLLHQAEEYPKYSRNRIEWLEKLEENSKFNIENIAEKKFNISREVCCFPFNTFKIFAKSDVNVIDYYKKCR